MDHNINVFTDGSKTEIVVDSGIAIYVNNIQIRQMKHRLNNRSSNNQAVQKEILKTLHALEILKIYNNTPRKFKVFTESKITIFTLKKAKNKKFYKRNYDKDKGI